VKISQDGRSIHNSKFKMDPNMFRNKIGQYQSPPHEIADKRLDKQTLHNLANYKDKVKTDLWDDEAFFIMITN
jgi:hypothetical protein